VIFVSWPIQSGPDWVPQVSYDTVAPAVWSDVQVSPTQKDNTYYVKIPIITERAYYRLRGM